MSYPVIFRKRLIPDECIELRDDVILEYTPGLIITSWNALKPKKDLHHGFSCYYPDRGYKVSRFCDKNDNLLYWYCDIVDYSYSDDKNSLTVTDLLVDVIIYPDGYVKVVDLDELAEASRLNLLSKADMEKTLVCLNSLLGESYHDRFSELTKPITRYI